MKCAGTEVVVAEMKLFVSNSEIAAGCCTILNCTAGYFNHALVRGTSMSRRTFCRKMSWLRSLGVHGLVDSNAHPDAEHTRARLFR
jgi:hypothetical protein